MEYSIYPCFIEATRSDYSEDSSSHTLIATHAAGTINKDDSSKVDAKSISF